MVVCTKGGFLTEGAVPAWLKPEHVVARMHSMTPDFLADQIDRSCGNLGVDTVDVFYVHNPETQLAFLSPEEFDTCLRHAFTRLEKLVEAGRIRWYGAATWNGLRMKGALNLARMAEIAAEAGGAEHHFRFVQLPFNTGMVEAYVEKPESVLRVAARLGIAVIASASLSQAQVLDNIPAKLAALLPDMTNAQRAIQFTRSTPGITAALVGMSRREHVVENLGVAKAPPIAAAEYPRLYL